MWYTLNFYTMLYVSYISVKLKTNIVGQTEINKRAREKIQGEADWSTGERRNSELPTQRQGDVGAFHWTGGGTGPGVLIVCES